MESIPEKHTPVLVVDDDEVVCKLNCKWLTREGFAVTVAHDGVEAARLFTTRMGSADAFKVVMIDESMPSMDGPTSISLMRLAEDRAAGNSDSGKALRALVIGVTGNSEKQDHAHFQNQGVSAGGTE